VTVNISLATADARLARLLELRSPVPAARLRALRRLIDGGIHAGLLVAPIIPGVTDDWTGLARLMEAAKEAGARYVVGSALRLGPAARHRFLPFLTREFPELAERYQRHYAGKDHVSQSYQDALTRRLRLLQQAHGFPVDEGMRRRRQLEGRAPREVVTAASKQQVLL
jgi:DNA repair photolyase